MLGRALKAQRLFTRGQHLAAQGQAEAALAVYEQALTLRPGMPGLHLHYALALSDTERFAEAVAALQHAIAQAPDNPVLPMFLGQISFDHQAYAQAATWCARALALSPHNSHALGLVALLALVTGQVPPAYAQFTQPLPRPLSLAERLCLWLGRGQLPLLVQQANPALQSRMLLAIETLLLQQSGPVRTLSEQLLALPEATAAEGFGDRLLGWIDHGCVRGLMALRWCSIMVRCLGRPARRATELRLMRAERALYLNQVELAEALYRPLAAQTPIQSLVLERLCELCYLQAKFPEALRYARRVLAQLPADVPPSAWQAFLLGELWYQVGAYDEAYAALQQAADHGLCDYKLLYYLGLCQLRQGQRLAARRSFAAAVQQLNPDITRLRLDELYRLSQPLPYTTT